MGSKINDINESDRSQIVNGLHVAAERFGEHVKAIQADIDAGRLRGDGYKSLVAQFESQAADCKRLATLILECDSMRLQVLERCDNCGEPTGNVDTHYCHTSRVLGAAPEILNEESEPKP